MADITDRRRALACALVLARSELHLGLVVDEPGSLRERCRQILTAARHGGLDVRAYRFAYQIARGTA